MGDSDTLPPPTVNKRGQDKGLKNGKDKLYIDPKDHNEKQKISGTAVADSTRITKRKMNAKSMELIQRIDSNADKKYSDDGDKNDDKNIRKGRDTSKPRKHYGLPFPPFHEINARIERMNIQLQKRKQKQLQQALNIST